MNRDVFFDTLYKLVTAGALVVLAYAELHNLPAPPAPIPVPTPAPAPTPGPAVTPIARAAKVYHDGIGQEFSDAASAVKAGTIKDLNGLAAFMLTHSGPLQAAIAASVKAHSGIDGVTFNDPAGMAVDLQGVADTLEGKK